MIFHQTSLDGPFLVELDRKEDLRGFFARAFCSKELHDHGVEFNAAQVNISRSAKKGTLRGMHYQAEPVVEPKFIRCIRGSVWDVIIDMRPGSKTFLQHYAVELSAENGLALYVPDRFAHGNQALTDDSELLYVMGGYYTPGYEQGVRHDDPAVGIQWPLQVTVIDDKDQRWPLIGAGAQ
jgi:dTDP-4-dehydrorhamnose 3,5-epimerase